MTLIMVGTAHPTKLFVLMSREKYIIQRVPGMPVSDEDLLADLRATANSLGRTTISYKLYRQLGKYADTTVTRRFGTWNKALIAAGLSVSVSRDVDISDERLFENILVLWQHYGRQPRLRELAYPPSIISQKPYIRRFLSWSGTLRAFVAYVNGIDEVTTVIRDSPTTRRKSRDPSLRLRWRVLQRDHFTCCACGASPALTPGIELHVDHIIAWSNGGETRIENLQTLCAPCNLGKANS